MSDATQGTETTSTPPAPAPAPVASGAPSQAPSPAAGEGDPALATQQQDRDDQGRFRNPVQPRIDQLTRRAGDAERERDYWKNLAIAQQAPATAAPKKPEVADFNDYSEYVEALADWKADQKIGKALEDHEAKREAKTQATQRATTWEGRQAAFRQVAADYDEVLSSADGIGIADHVGQALLESEHGPALAYHLAKNPDVADKLNRMSPLGAARELGRIEANLSAQAAAPAPSNAPAPSPAASAPAPAPAVRTTSAPPPAKTVQAPAASQPADLSKLSMDDYVKAREQQGASWGRRRA